MNPSVLAKNVLWENAEQATVQDAVIESIAKPVLRLADVSVSFDGFQALNRLTLSVEAGELRCIIGPNGAGKTTLMDVITGKTRPDTGTVAFGGADLTRLSEPEIAQLGVGRKFQKPTVLENHTVFENLEIAMKTNKGVWHTLWARLSSEQCDRISAMLTRIHLMDEALRPAGILSHGQKQWLEIGMLLMQEPKLLLLDEPVAGMTDHERERTAELVKALAGKHSVVLVEHDMEFIQSIARVVTVLDEGTVLAQGTMAEIQHNEKVIEVYLGR